MDHHESLKKRQIPSMQLSNVCTPGSKTIGSDPFSTDLSPAESAALRFHVGGNALITGGTGALALAAARVFLEQGCDGLALLDINISNTASHPQVDWLRARFPERKILTLQCDVAARTSVDQAVQAAVTQLGPIKHMAHFAGVVSCVHAMDISPAEWTRVLSINTSGSFNMAQAAAKHMRGHGLGGSIVLIASVSAHRVNYPQPQAAYNASKAAVLHLVHCLAAEWAVFGIRVNSVSPGYADTVLNEGDGLQAARESWISRNPMGRMALPHEIAGPTVMLCSASASYINGADLVVDGGGLVF